MRSSICVLLVYLLVDPCIKRCSLLCFIHHLIVVGPRGRGLGGVVQYPLGSDQHHHTSSECGNTNKSHYDSNGQWCRMYG